MKKILFCISLVAFAAINFGFAQNPVRPNSIAFKRLFIDYHSPYNGEFSNFKNYKGGFELAYIKNMNKWFNVGIPVKFGLVDLPEELNQKTSLGIDAIVQLQYFKEKNLVVPYLFGGVGTVMEDFDELNFQIPVGIGFNFKLSRFFYVNYQSEYRSSLTKGRNNFQHGIGIVFLIGKITEEELLPIGNFPTNDSDGDGIPNKKDKCPELAGKKAFSGCPDSDNDGIPNVDDECPFDAGTKKTNGCPDDDGDGFANKNDDCPTEIGTVRGCPDTDGDGIADISDSCPKEAGKASNNGCPESDYDEDGIPDHIDRCPDVAGTFNGCPDTDGDKIPDNEDACPRAAGPISTKGCPDTDGDGLDDSKDQCPNSAGPAASNGCPEVAVADKTVLREAIQAVQFETGSSVLKTDSYNVLSGVADIMYKYPDYTLDIIGHTDNLGTEQNNETLSIKRARACHDYLISIGVPPSKLSYGGFGETKPISSNDTTDGRSLNRRVEFNLGL